MRKFIIIILLLASGCASTGGSPSTYEFYYNSKADGEKLTANTFSSVFAVYFHILRKVDLHRYFNESDMQKITLKIIKSLEDGKAIQLQVPNMTGSRPLIVTFRTDITTKKSDKPTLFVTTNYNREKKKAVPYKSSKNKDSFANLFYLLGDKLVLYYYVEEPSSESEIEAMTIVKKTGYYLFDDNFENDQSGKKLLIKSIKKEEDNKEKVYQMVTLAYYQLLFGEYKTARKSLDDALLIANKESDQSKRKHMMHNLRIAENIYSICMEYEKQLKES